MEVVCADETLLKLVEESRESLAHIETKLKELETREEALKIRFTTNENSTKALHEEIEHLNKEFSLFKAAIKKMEEKLKTNLGEVEAEILKTHEAKFNKALRQVKYFFKDVETSHFVVHKDITCQRELVDEVGMPTEEVPNMS